MAATTRRPSCARPSPSTGIKFHEAAFNLAALATGGNRLAGTRGHELSADYVALQSRLAGLNVSRQDFDYDLFALGDWKPPVLDVRRGKHYIPGIAGSIPGGDFGSMVNSASGDITAPVWAADLTHPVAGARTRRTSGCEAADFAGMPQGAIVLLQRGTCGDRWPSCSTRRPRAPAAIVYINEGNVGVPGRDRPALVRHDGRRRDDPDRGRAGRDRRRTSPAASAQGLVGKTARLRVEWPHRHRRRPRT